MNRQNIHTLDDDSIEGMINLLKGDKTDQDIALDILNNVDMNDNNNVKHIVHLMHNTKLSISYDFEDPSSTPISKKFKFIVMYGT